jgi:hypothetical protein
MALDWEGPNRATRCAGCNKLGPARPKATDARAAAKAAGWARSYPGGRGESFRCPDCRHR